MTTQTLSKILDFAGTLPFEKGKELMNLMEQAIQDEKDEVNKERNRYSTSMALAEAIDEQEAQRTPQIINEPIYRVVQTAGFEQKRA